MITRAVLESSFLVGDRLGRKPPRPGGGIEALITYDIRNKEALNGLS